MAEHKKHAGHGIKSTHIHHHHDGSHTVEQHHEDGTMASSAKGDLDQVHDHLENTIGSPNRRRSRCRRSCSRSGCSCCYACRNVI
jgi:hypothetical protein